MATVFDVAAYILDKQGDTTAMKLQKLCYYSHAWHLVWDERPLFSEPIEAWANGPVSPSLYAAHRGAFRVSSMPGWTQADPSKLSAGERATVDAVLEFYGAMSAHQLSELTHSEEPWAYARSGLPAGARSNKVITDDSMARYYDGLTRAATEA
jgi:uncharacterized phage-associated protein